MQNSATVGRTDTMDYVPCIVCMALKSGGSVHTWTPTLPESGEGGQDPRTPTGSPPLAPSLTPYAPLSLDCGFATPTHLCKISIAIPGTGKAKKQWTSNLAGTFTFHRVHPNKSSLYILEKRERGCMCIQRLSKFLEYPLLSREWAKLRTSNFLHTFVRSIGTKAHLKYR